MKTRKFLAASALSFALPFGARQCAPPPPPPPLPVCSGIYSERGWNDGLQEGYTALCGSGQGWIEVTITCGGTEDLQPDSWLWRGQNVEYRPLNYRNPDATNTFMENTLTVSVTCPVSRPYVYPLLTTVVETASDPR